MNTGLERQWNQLSHDWQQDIKPSFELLAL